MASRGLTSLAIVRPYWMLGALILLTQAPTVAFVTVQPLLLRKLVDDAVLPGNTRLALLVVAGMFALLATNALGDLANQYVVARAAARLLNDIRLRIFTHVQTLSVQFYSHVGAGDLMARFTSDLDTIERVITGQLSTAVYVVLTMIIGGVILFTIEWRLALFIVFLLPTLYVAQRILSPGVSRATDRRQAVLGHVTSRLHEILAAELVVKAFGLQELLLGQFRKDQDEFARQAVRAGLVSGVLAATMTATSYSVLALSIGVGTLLALRHELSVGSLIAFLELVWFLVGAVAQLSTTIPPFAQAAAGMRRIQELLEQRPDVADAPGARPLPAFHEGIRFQGVSFHYDDSPEGIREVSVTLPARGSVAIVGPSGSGKTTMLNLLMRFYDPTSGSITIDGHDLREVTQDSLRAQMGAVLQESFLFSGTVRENIRLGRLDATDEEVDVAARAAEAFEFLSRLPHGYDTVISEGGGRLSGGQRQRIALARAVVRRPRILVLDEPTSALDAPTESSIVATLERLARDCLVVMVTHRLSAVTKAIQILVLENGRLVEQGNHQSLLARGGVYHRAWQRQTGFVVTPDGRRARVQPRRLRAIPLFQALDDAHLATIADRFVTERYGEGEMIFDEGAAGERLYIIVRGQVEVLKDGSREVPRVVARLMDGDFFGEIALLENVPRTAAVRTKTSCLMLELDRDDFIALLNAEPQLRARVERVAMARRQELSTAE